MNTSEPESSEPVARNPSLSSIGLELLFRAIGFLISVVLWGAASGLFGYIGGSMGGLRQGGWNFQYLGVIVMALYMGPIAGTCIAIISGAAGRGFWKAMFDALAGVCALSLVGSFIFYATRGG